MTELTCKRLANGKYEYRGYVITNHGYYAPDKCIWWEAVNMTTGEADHHEHTKREIKRQIDQYATAPEQP